MSDNIQKTAPHFLVTNGKIYGVCADCGNIVCLNKPLFGALHFCTTEDERKRYPRSIARKTSLNQVALLNARQF